MIVVAVLALLPAVLLFGILGLRAPLRVLLPLYAGLVPFGSGIALPIGIPSPFNTVTTLTGLAVLVGVGVHLLLGRAHPQGLPPEAVAWVLFAALNGLTYLWSVDRPDTAERFVILASLAALYVVVVLAPVRQVDADRLRDGIIVGGSVACAYGFYLLLTGALPEEKAGLPRFATAGGVGDASDPNITAATLTLPLVLALHRALHAPTTRVRLLASGATALIAAGLLLTASRGGTLAAVIAIVVLLGHERHPGRLAAGVAVAMAVVVVVGAALAPEQVDRLSTTGSSGRTNIWEVGRVACEEHCLTGSGLNTFVEVHRRAYLTTPGATGARIDEPPHNIWLGAAIELGFTGIVLLATALALTVRSLRRLPREVRGAPLGALVGLLVSNMFLANLYFKYFWLVLVYAAVVSLAAKATSEDELDATAAPATLPVPTLVGAR